MKVGELLEAIDRMFPFLDAGAWDPVGLQIGDRESGAASVAVCHEVTPGVVDRTLEDGIDLLVSYHPLLFDPTTEFTTGSDAVGRAVILTRARVSLIVVHTAFDVARPGTADAFLAALGLEAATTFAPVDEEGGADIGRTAVLDAPMTLGDLTSAVETTTQWAPRVNMPQEFEVSTVGVVPGSGNSFVEEAIDTVDCLITGDVSHHAASLAAAAGLAIIDAGHAPSELAGVQSLYSHIVGLAPGAIMLDEGAHPWRV